MGKVIKQIKKKEVDRAKRVTKGSLRLALIAKLKNSGGRSDINFREAPTVAEDHLQNVKLEDRAGYPLSFPKGSVNPKNWITTNGVKVEVDFSRPSWLPDEWGQGVKTTIATSHSTGGSGGTYTVLVSPDGKIFYHRPPAEEYDGKPFSDERGFGGQIRLARLQSQQAVHLVRMQIKEVSKSSGSLLDKDEALFKLLSPAERKCLPRKEDLHFCVVSARRATDFNGVKDIFMVESQCREAGVQPTWYVDQESLKDYKKLNLNAVVGGKLTAARNKCLKDANAKGKICVQCSDDISAWEYRDGKAATVRTDDAMNAAHAAAKRVIVSPVAAARFMVAKMRGVPEAKKPKLAGVYMLGSCARTFAGEPFSQLAFCIGDFFVVDVGSEVRFDENMKLKEDYDFTCAHIKEHGSVLRCNRMTLTVKHYSNSGGAVTNRDSKGMEEQRNIAILNEKWPGCFRPNPKRANEVILKWKDAPVNDTDDADDDVDEAEITPMKATKALTVKKASVKKAKASDVKAAAPRKRRPVATPQQASEPAASADPEQDPEAAPSATNAATAAGTKKTKTTKASTAKASATKASATKASAAKVKKVTVKSKQAPTVKKSNVASAKAANLPAPNMTLASTTSEASVEYIRSRCKQISGQTVESVLGKLQYTNAAGKQKVYSVQDLRYDLMRGFLVAKGGA
mmetsp:Transcript_103118/g.210268  ORF Transcript_103118/g.210268 Transcript_103118/m.210268 type:complete len:683 (+) Transcript_103118:74-2122(+)